MSNSVDVVIFLYLSEAYLCMDEKCLYFIFTLAYVKMNEFSEITLVYKWLPFLMNIASGTPSMSVAQISSPTPVS
jgi:hypothetical protein